MKYFPSSVLIKLNINSSALFTNKTLYIRCAKFIWKLTLKIKGSKSGDYEEIREKQFTKLLSNGSLLLQNVKEDREGFYLCQAQNGIGSGISKVIQLKVNCKWMHLKKYQKKKTLLTH